MRTSPVSQLVAARSIVHWETGVRSASSRNVTSARRLTGRGATARSRIVFPSTSEVIASPDRLTSVTCSDSFVAADASGTAPSSTQHAIAATAACSALR